MGAGDRAHRFRRRIVVEQHPAAAIDLQIDEAGRYEAAGWQPKLPVVGRNFAPGGDPAYSASVDQNRCFGVPAPPIENTVGQTACFSLSSCGFISGLYLHGREKI